MMARYRRMRIAKLILKINFAPTFFCMAVFLNLQKPIALRGAERDQQYVILKAYRWADFRSAGFAARTSHVTRFRCRIHGVLP